MFSAVSGLIPPRGAFSMVCLSLVVQYQYSHVIVEALISIIDICKRINWISEFTKTPGTLNYQKHEQYIEFAER